MSNFGDHPAGFFGDSSFYNSAATTSFRNDPGVVLTDECDAPTSAKIMSFGGWVKRNKLGFYSNLFSGTLGGSGVPQASLYFDTDDKIKSISYTGSAYVYDYRTAALFRDINSWYHIWVQIDTTDGTQADRFKLYVNGVRITVFSNAGLIADGSPDIRGFNEDGLIAYFGHTNASYGGNVYYSDWYFIDGSAVSPVDTVGEFKGGVFIPKKYSPTFGNNGFNLKFDQVGVGSPSSSTIGADSSGSSRHFISTAGTDAVASDCALPDSPENNFCTWNPLTAGAQNTFTEGNLKNTAFWSADLSGNASTFFPESGKWYWELRVDGTNTYPYIGITSQEKLNDTVNGGTFYNIAWHAGGTGQNSGSSLGTITKENIPSFADDDIISFALDVDARKLWVAENNTYADSGDPANGSGENASWTVDVGVSPVIMGYNGQGVGTIANFGQDDTFAGAISSAGNTDGNGKGVFKYAPPSGFLSLCTANLPEPTIGPNSSTQSDDYFNTVLYTGGSSGQGITGVGFKPDWTWIKSTSHASSHVLTDSSRGVTESLFSDTTGAESTLSGGVTAFGTDGFTLGTEGTVNTNTRKYVAWNWKANGGTATATISESGNNPAAVVQANPTAGFSIVAYTGTQAAGTIAHGLGAVPKMMIFKNRAVDGNGWIVYHAGNTAAPETDFLFLDNTNTTADNANRFNDTAPTNSVFTLGADANINDDGVACIGFIFAEVEGYSKFGSYTANGLADGTFVNLGFRPAFVMLKNTSNNTNGGNWVMMDDTRLGDDVGAINPILSHIKANDNDAEFDSASYPMADFLSNGFKLRLGGTGSGLARNVNNADGNIYIFMAFASSPFKYANAF